MADTFETITFELTDGIARLRLNRPQFVNALNRKMLSEIAVALDTVLDRGQARVLLIAGGERGFCAGADLKEGGVTDVSQDYDAGAVLEHHYNPLIEKLFALPLPVVAAVQGAVCGAGCMLALAADFVIAARSAYFQQSFTRVGLIPDAGSLWLLPRLVGRSRALAMTMLGERIPVATAEQWGLIHESVADDLLEATATALVERLAMGPTRAYGIIRRGVRFGLDRSLTETLEWERNQQCVAGRTRDFAEGVSAFRAKRPPQFTGK